MFLGDDTPLSNPLSVTMRYGRAKWPSAGTIWGRVAAMAACVGLHLEGEMPAPVSVAQRQAIVALLKEGLDRHQIAAQVGVTPGQVAAIKSHVSMGTYRDDADNEVEGEVATAFDTAFGLEHDLQLALRKSIEQLEPGLMIIDGDREQTVASGRIDITARDKDGWTVVIELKAGPADRDAVGQILSYMGDLTDGTTWVRGIVVAREFSSRAIAAARAAPNVRLVQYGFRFSFEMISTAG